MSSKISIKEVWHVNVEALLVIQIGCGSPTMKLQLEVQI